MLTKTLKITNARNAKTLSPSHMKQCIMSEARFDFLRELVKNIPDINVAEEQLAADDYPERRESSEDATSSPQPQSQPQPQPQLQPQPQTEFPSHSNGSEAIPKRAHDNIESCASSSGTSSQWKLTKQHSMDSITNKNQSFYALPDSDTPINYSMNGKFHLKIQFYRIIVHLL